MYKIGQNPFIYSADRVQTSHFQQSKPSCDLENGVKVIKILSVLLYVLAIQMSGLLVAHFENIGFYTGSSSSKYRLFTGFSIKNIG